MFQKCPFTKIDKLKFQHNLLNYGEKKSPIINHLNKDIGCNYVVKKKNSDFFHLFLS